MSGGQRQRVVIAMAMLMKPKLIIADEPTTALDKAVEGKILALLKKLVRESGAALWLISHDLEVVAEVADEVVVLFRGETVETGPAKQVFTAPKHPLYEGAFGMSTPEGGASISIAGAGRFSERYRSFKTGRLSGPHSC